MKVNIKNAAPILEKDRSQPQHIHNWHVSGWEVQGSVLFDENGCPCKTKDFDLNIRIEKMNVTNKELIEAVKERLK